MTLKILSITEISTNYDQKWTREQIDRVASLLEAGKTYSQISDTIYAEFGVRYSRCSVISRARRSGLASLTVRKPGSFQDGRKKRPKKTSTSRNVVALPQRPRVRTAPVFTPAPLSEDERQFASPLLDLRPRDCRWPVHSDGETSLFCCRPQAEGPFPYCAHHMARALRRCEPATGTGG